ncbi:MAG: hypothetical protein DHS20C01_22030 [marine bacterium B5-7]|nr:MAG: hypothetical protein DHS20C01_22030 [marine bacterium B5-7]
MKNDHTQCSCINPPEVAKHLQQQGTIELNQGGIGSNDGCRSGCLDLHKLQLLQKPPMPQSWKTSQIIANE